MEPTTLQEAIVYFSDLVNCREYLVTRRWPDGVLCPRCGSKNVLFLEKYDRWHCREKHDAPQFTLKTGTVMEDSPISLTKWLPVMWLLVNCKNGISSYEVHRAIGVTQKSAWFMLHRIRTAMMEADGPKLGKSNLVEVDETFIGGKVKNMHKSKRKIGMNYSAGNGKTIVMGMLERGGKVRAGVIEDRRKRHMQPMMENNLETGSHIITDEHANYPLIATKNAYYHEIINHVEGYVRDHVHTNSIENFWSCLKRGLSGTYISVDPVHLDKYVDEQVFRFNNRVQKTDADRFNKVLSQVPGRRLTYESLTGKVVGGTAF
jgi:transposase-like protein